MTIFLLLFTVLSFPSKSIQQQQYDGCSYINGQGCMDNICKFCAMCVPSSCILATPYSTGNNEGSTCKATQQSDGYDFYNYCISSGTDDDGDFCNTSTQCYQYRQSNATHAMHSWNNLTCDRDSCLLVNMDGTAPAVPTPLDNSTIVTPITNTTDTHHPTPNNNGGENRHHNRFDIKSGSATSIALTSVCIVVSLCLVAWLIRTFLYKSKYWSTINRYLCCGHCTYIPKTETTSTSNSSTTSSSIPNSAPPSFHSSGTVMRSTNNNNNNNNNNGELLPNYFQQDPSPPKYEQAIVTQIRGMSFFDHHPTNNNNGDSSSQQQPIWVPVYLSSIPPPPQQQQQQGQSNHGTSFSTFISRNNAQDWATQTMRHQPTSSASSTEDVITRRNNNNNV